MKKMCLKEAFQYQNFLSCRLEDLVFRYLRRDYVVNIEETHRFHSVNSKKEDEIKKVDTKRPFECEVDDLINLSEYLLNEKEKLANAIATAKKTIEELDMDTALAMNKSKQEMARIMNDLSQIKRSEKEEQGIDYTFDVDSRQTEYYYPVKTVKTIDFNRNVTKAIAKRLLAEADETSMKIDKIKLTTEVDYEPPFNVRSSIDDIIEEYLSN